MSFVNSWACASQCNFLVPAGRFACERPLALPEAFVQQLSPRGSVRGPLEPTRLRADACMLRLPRRISRNSSRRVGVCGDRSSQRGCVRMHACSDCHGECSDCHGVGGGVPRAFSTRSTSPSADPLLLYRAEGECIVHRCSDRMGTRLRRAPVPMAMTSCSRDLMPRVRCGSFSVLIKLPRSALA